MTDYQFPKADRAAIIAPPPLLALGCIGVAYLARHYKSLSLFSSRSSLQLVAGAVLVLFSIAIVASARRVFMAHATNLNPYKPTKAVVTTGVYRFSRNPIYVAFLIFVLSFTFFANSLWFVVLDVLLFFLLHFGVVKREEVYLEAKFGDSYLDYCRQVKRWL
jgi:protein-S-isoprenylcysteine O-methyltransferase Ste14